MPNLIHGQFGQRRNIPASSGKYIEFRKFSSLSAATTALTEGSSPAGSSLSMTAATAAISQYGDYVKGSDIIQYTAIDNVLTETAELLGEQMGLTIDIIDREVMDAGTTVQYASTATSRGGLGSGMLLNAAELREAVRTLKRNNIRPHTDGKYIAIIHPDTWADLMGDSDIWDAFLYAQTRGDQNNIFQGQLGDFLGVRFIESTNAKTWASTGISGADIYATLMIGLNSYGITELDNFSAQTYHVPAEPSKSDPLAQYWIEGWKAAHTACILDQNALVRIEHITTYKQAA